MRSGEDYDEPLVSRLVPGVRWSDSGRSLPSPAHRIRQQTVRLPADSTFCSCSRVGSERRLLGMANGALHDRRTWALSPGLRLVSDLGVCLASSIALCGTCCTGVIQADIVRVYGLLLSVRSAYDYLALVCVDAFDNPFSVRAKVDDITNSW